MCEWSERWILKFHPENVKPCQSQIVMKRNAATHLYRHLPYMEISNAEKDIGVVIDDKLLFSQHMAESK